VTSSVGRKFSKRGGNAGGQRFYATFITPEAKKLLLEYRRYRESKEEQIRPDSPLIEHRGRSITVSAFEYSWRVMLQKAGLAERSQKWHKLHLHTLRKFFRTNCVGIDPSYREFWMGHRGGYLDESYFRADEKKHLEEYRKTIGHLSIMEPSAISEEQLIETGEVNRFREQIKHREMELQQLVNGLTTENMEYRNRIAKVEMEVIEMRKLLEKLNS
jgi:integrase